jgi:peptidoglycan/xylan/chitin deacetylase (PgdA/CDA1 family)
MGSLPAAAYGPGKMAWSLTAVKRAAALADRVRKPDRGVVVLLYHRVGRRTKVSVDLPAWLFEEQISRLSGGPGVVDLDAALGQLQNGLPEAGGPDPVVVTFDDGTADFVDLALPILVRYRVPATIYVATDFIDRGRPFPDDGVPLSWAAVGEAVSTGLVTVGSHTHSHALLDRTDPLLAAAELDRSIELIAEHVGTRPSHFAYPKALLAGPETEGEVRARFASAALAGTRANPYRATDPYRLARSPLQVDDGLRFFERKLAGGMHLEESARRLKNAAVS